MSGASAQQLRELIRASRFGALSTHGINEDRGVAGYPQGSSVLIAADMDASPLLLISTLADHTKNLAADPRCSLLLVPEAGADNQRLTLFAEAKSLARSEALTNRYLARHPEAEIYVGFADFAFYRLQVDQAYWVGGFGKQRWVKGADLCPSVPVALREAADSIVSHMNEDHLDALAKMAAARNLDPKEGWRMCGIDQEGFEMTSESGNWQRICFESPIASALDARHALVKLTRDAE